MNSKKQVSVVASALRFRQGDCTVYCFALPGKMLAQIADISRLKRGEKDKLEGFQRKEIQQHVKQITDYLNKGPGLFPNAIILALAPQIKFTKARGTKSGGVVEGVEPGRLNLPVNSNGDSVAWIVDGQQRSLALAASINGELLVPVIAFESASLSIQRQQFILVNRARPLPQRLVNELLPETDDAFLPKDLAMRKAPSELCSLLLKNPGSPFYERIDRTSAKLNITNAITDSAVISMIKDRIMLPTGALAHYRGFNGTGADLNAMYRMLQAYWNAVAETFPEAWRLPPEKSRLTHAVGIRAMGSLMDRISSRIKHQEKDLKDAFAKELRTIQHKCAWTKGTWELANVPWNHFEMTSKSLAQLSGVINALYMKSEDA